MVPSCNKALARLAAASLVLLSCCFAQVLGVLPVDPHNSLAMLQQRAHVLSAPEAGDDGLEDARGPCDEVDCDSGGGVSKKGHHGDASQPSVLPDGSNSSASEQHESAEQREDKSKRSGEAHDAATEPVLEAARTGSADHSRHLDEAWDELDGTGEEQEEKTRGEKDEEDVVTTADDIVTRVEIRANETGKGQVCVSVPVFEEAEWVDALIRNFVHFTWPGTKLAIHLDATTEYREKDIQRWNKTSSKVVVNPERIHVLKFKGSLLYTYIMNAKFLESLFPGVCGYFVMQESNMFWVRANMERAVYQGQYSRVTPYPCFGKKNPDIIDHPFFKILTNKRVENMAWMAPEGFFLPMKHLLNFIDLLDKWIRKEHVDVADMILHHYGAIEEVWLPTYLRNKARGLPPLPEGVEFRPLNKRSPGMSVEQLKAIQNGHREFAVKRILRDPKDPGTKYVLGLAP